MKRTSLILALPLLCGLAFAFHPSPSTAPLQHEHADGDHEHHEESALHEGMKQLKRSIRTLRKSLKDEGRNEESLLAIVEAQRGVSLCKTEVPPFTKKQPEAERAAFVLAYRSKLIQVERALLDLEEAMLAGDNEKSQGLLKIVKKMEGPGHDRFTEDEDED